MRSVLDLMGWQGNSFSRAPRLSALKRLRASFGLGLGRSFLSALEYCVVLSTMAYFIALDLCRLTIDWL